MKIAIDVAAVRTTGEVGGAMQHAIELIKGFSERYMENHYLLLTGDWNHDYFKSFEHDNIEVMCIAHSHTSSKISSFRLDITRRFYNWAKIKMGWIIKNRIENHKFLFKEKGIDLLFCPLSAITYAQPSVATVSVINDIQHEYYTQFFTPIELNHRRHFYREICKGADAVVCISDFTKRSLIEKLNYPEEKLFVNHICIHDRLVRLSNNDDIKYALDRLRLSDIVYAYYPANFWPHKNHKILITAFSMFKQKYPQLNLHLVFTGALIAQYEDVKNAVKQMGIEDMVHFLGYLPENDIAALMSNASFIIFPSLFEGFGIPVLEAMSFGKPVLCSNSTSLPEVGGEAALYFDPRKPDQICDAMWRILTDNQLRQISVEKGFTNLKRFNRDQMIDRYMEIFYRVNELERKANAILDGIFLDGWGGPIMSILTGCIPKPYEYQIGVCFPPHRPGTKASITVLENGIKQRIYKIRKDQELVIKGIIQKNSIIEIIIDPVFCPSNYGSPDQRELGLTIIKAVLFDKKQQKVIKNFLASEENNHVL